MDTTNFLIDKHAPVTERITNLMPRYHKTIVLFHVLMKESFARLNGGFSNSPLVDFYKKIADWKLTKSTSKKISNSLEK